MGVGYGAGSVMGNLVRDTVSIPKGPNGLKA